jgi:molecular chaperone DnaK
MSVVGIDLGTTNTVVACVRDGRVHVLADEKGNRLLPSVVSFHPNGDVLVGPAARERRLVDAKNTIASIKRLIGRPWDSDEIRLARSRFPFELREGPGQGALVIARGEAYTLPEISAFVLKRVRQIAEAALGETVDKAVITVPAHFNELQRASTKVAGRVAGLEVLRILNEPTAAALAYGFGSDRSERVAVYDFGGGTFDCSLLDLTGTLFEVLATAGDTFLGGDDIDTAIADVMCNAFLAQHRYDPRVDPQAFERLRAAAEQLKKDLSVNMQAQVDLPEVAYGVGGKRLGFTFGLTQADLDSLATPFIDRTLQVTQDSLNIAHLTPSSFDQIVLVGGSTRMPLVARRVEAFFGIPCIDRVNPDEVVAVGAAVQAAALVDATRKGRIPGAPVPGVIGPPQRMPQDDSPTAMQPSPLSDRPRQPPPAPAAPVIKTLRPGLAIPTPFGSFQPQALARTGEDRSISTTTGTPFEADADDHSIGTGHTMPAAQGQGPPSMTNVLQNFPAMAAAARTGANPAAKAAPEPTTLASAKAPPAKKSVPPPIPPSARSPQGGSQPPARPSGGWGVMRPLETEDISRVVPEGFMPGPPGAVPPLRQLPSSPSLGPRGVNVGPLETEDISRIVPEGHRIGDPIPPLRQLPSHPPASNSLSPRGIDVGPLATEDISMIVPDRSNPGARAPSPFGGARPPPPAPPRAAPAPFAFPPFPGQDQPTATFDATPPEPLPPARFQMPSFGSLPSAQAPGPFDFPPVGSGGTLGAQAPFPATQMRNALPAALPTDYSPPAGWENAPAPVLVDVTPRALVVETVGGYCDTVIPRNAKIPCEHTRVFATGRDLQTIVHVRVAQGEDEKFEKNQYLGELELSNLRPATRGEVTLSVTFELDANGSLLVRAIDSSTGRQAHATMKLIAVAQSEEAIEEMIERSRSVSVVG